MRGLKFSFEPADVVNEVMSFGSPTPIEVAVSGPNSPRPRLRREGAASSWRRFLRSATCSSRNRSTIPPWRCAWTGNGPGRAA